MNPYQFEPHNPFGGKPREKHWTEIAEEEALYARMLAESQAAQLTQTTAVAAGAGAGGSPPRAFFRPNVTPGFSVSPTTAFAPLTALISNTSNPDVIQFCNNQWTYGDGTTSTGPTPNSKLYNTGSFDISLTASAFFNGVTSTSGPTTVVGLAPSVTASFTTSSTTPTGPAPLTVTFVNNSINTSQTPTSTYFWLFGSGSLSGSISAQASSSATNPTLTYWKTGSYTVILQITGSYGTQASQTRIAYVSASVT